MWLLYAIVSSFFAGITSILAKCGIQKTNSNVATAIRTIVVLLFSWLMVFLTGTWTGIMQISGKRCIGGFDWRRNIVDDFYTVALWQKETS